MEGHRMSQTDLPAVDPEIGDPVPFDPTDHSDFGGGNPAAAPTEAESFTDYWGVDIADVWYFPDGKQFIGFKKLNEGERSKYQKQINRDITVERQSGNARMKVDQSTDRHALLSTAVTGWNIKRFQNGGWVDVPFSHGTPGSTFEQWMNGADPSLVDDLEKAVRKLNPWLTTELSVMEIDEMIADLQTQREDAVKREAGN